MMAKLIFACRFFWCFFVVASIISCNLMVLSISQRYRENPVKMVVDSSHLSTAGLAIPALTICRINRINYGRAVRFVNTL